MNRRVFIDDKGIINVVSEAIQTRDTVRADVEQVTLLAKDLRAEGRPVLLLADLTQAKKISLAARQAGFDFFRAGIDRVAGFGNIPRLEMLGTYIAKLCGYKNLKIFADRSEAESFLLAGRK